MVILDVMSIALGFLLRVIGGALVIKVYISPWILLCTLLLSLFLGFSKRRNELVVLENGCKFPQKDTQGVFTGIYRQYAFHCHGLYRDGIFPLYFYEQQ